jgi:SprT-like family
MFAVTSHSRPQLDFADMRAFLEHGWGELGLRVAGCWRDFNDRYFDGRLKPLPIVLVATSPHGHWLGLTHGSRNGHGTHRIELTHPGMGARLIADRTTLLHEMIHQALVEQGVNPHHDKEPWRAEITRLHAALTGGEQLWCAFDQVRKVNGRSVRVPAPAPGRTCGRSSRRTSRDGHVASVCCWDHYEESYMRLRVDRDDGG